MIYGHYFLEENTSYRQLIKCNSFYVIIIYTEAKILSEYYWLLIYAIFILIFSTFVLYLFSV